MVVFEVVWSKSPLFEVPSSIQRQRLFGYFKPFSDDPAKSAGVLCADTVEVDTEDEDVGQVQLSGSGHAAVGVDDGTVNVGCLIGGEEGEECGDVFGLVQGPERHGSLQQFVVGVLGELIVPVHRRVRSTRGDGVDANRLLDEFCCQGSGHLYHSALGGAVGHQIRRTHEGRVGSDVDDVALAGEDVGEGCLAHEERAVNVDGEHLAPVLGGHVDRVLHPGDGRNVAEHVESSVLANTFGDCCTTFGGIGDVGHPGVQRATCGGNVGYLSCHFVKTVGIDVHTEYGCTLRRESQCDAASHAAGNPGNGCDSANVAMIPKRGLCLFRHLCSSNYSAVKPPSALMMLP